MHDDPKLTIRVPGGMKTELERLAAQQERSVAGTVRYALSEFIGRDYDRQMAELERETEFLHRAAGT